MGSYASGPIQIAVRITALTMHLHSGTWQKIGSVHAPLILLSHSFARLHNRAVRLKGLNAVVKVIAHIHEPVKSGDTALFTKGAL